MDRRHIAAAVLVWIFAVTATASAQTFSVVTELNASGEHQLGGLIKASNGVLYGTFQNSATTCGGVYRVATDGTSSVVHGFTGPDGCQPVGELVQAPDGHLYGTTSVGGPNSDLRSPSGTGTIFRILLPDETFEMVHAFAPYDNDNNWYPEGVGSPGGLTVGTDNNLYGIANDGPFGCGVVFRFTTAGVFSVLHSLSFEADGCGATASLTLGPDGNFYGTTVVGGSGDHIAAAGTVFKVTPGGVFTRLYAFVQGDAIGYYPNGGPLMDSAGNLYGTTSAGPALEVGSGTAWKLSPSGQMTLLKKFGVNFDGGVTIDGTFPSGLTWGSDGLLYGVTRLGGVNGRGVVFRVGTSGGFQRLHSFNGTDGFIPNRRLLETSPGVFIGTTLHGGTSDSGVVFRLTVPVLDVDVNGEDGPLTLHAGDPFHLTIAFETNDAVIVDPARLYIGVATATPFGVWWLKPSGFSSVFGPVYSGQVPAIPTATVINIPNAAALPAGQYVWFMLVDTDGPIDIFDYVHVTVSP